MKPKYKKQIKEILNNFDFEYVCETMGEDLESWGYFGGHYPQADGLKEVARGLLWDAVDDPKRYSLRMTHGLLAIKFGDWLSLYSIATWWEAS